MGFGDKLLGLFAPSGDTIKGVTEGVGGLAKDVREAITGEENKLKVQEAFDKVLMGLQQIAMVEAQGNWFQRSWRPGLAWVIIFGIMVQYLIYPLAAWICEWTGAPPPPPHTIDTKDLWPIILGLIGYRTFEKTQAVTS